MFTLQPDSPTPLVTQIVDGLRRLIVDGSLRTGAKIPSIRHFAKTHQVSVFTVVEAYDRLVAQGYLLTHGSSHALDLAIRRLVRAGDAVLVDDPGYSNELFALRVAGARLIPVPRTPHGYDLAALEEAIVTHHPRVFFTQPRLQSPTT